MEVSRVLDAASRIVVVSPHFDDAVLSLGGLIATRAGRGQTVEVLTVFSAAGATLTGGARMRAFSDYGPRVAEDDRALALLGARPTRLGLSERLFRDPPPRGPLPLFHTSPEMARGAYPEKVRQAITRLRESPGTIVLAPLGIGHHVDHVIVALGALRAAAEGPGVLFYEDYNALSERNRRRHPVTRLRPFPYRAAPAWGSPRAGFELEATSLLARGPDPIALAGLTVRREQWQLSPAPVDAAAESAKLRAIAEYRTQTKALGGESALRELLRRAHAVRGGESVWQFRPGGGR
ncbi:PIG-L deacetylase family protein [Nocardia sp. NPDC059240]|uniref:PIG-L deacetylase family protein n=1 Tax=Nocardia sp. NPDC059240 TaxID=3346786 RepID=UPI0036A646AD